MKCDEFKKTVYEGEEKFSPGERLSLAFHVFFCGRCARELRRFEDARELLASGFIPPSPDFTDAVMAKIYEEEGEEEVFDIPGGVSTRGWVIAGVLILLSLATAFFGGDFSGIAASQGSSFLLPLGIIIGIIVSAYGALFIGSHLKELSARFRLH
ncbi:MAG: peptidoglycan-binding protein [Treponema sp.]|jgi:hypothetical protein|nr:peptidoglycan-binding protein [Treponema sp.]